MSEGRHTKWKLLCSPVPSRCPPELALGLSWGLLSSDQNKLQNCFPRGYRSCLQTAACCTAGRSVRHARINTWMGAGLDARLGAALVGQAARDQSQSLVPAWLCPAGLSLKLNLGCCEASAGRKGGCRPPGAELLTTLRQGPSLPSSGLGSEMPPQTS